jgi:hypothetical protein
VTVTSRAAGRPRSARLWLPAVDESVRGFDTALASQNRQAILLAPARELAVLA